MFWSTTKWILRQYTSFTLRFNNIWLDWILSLFVDKFMRLPDWWLDSGESMSSLSSSSDELNFKLFQKLGHFSILASRWWIWIAWYLIKRRFMCTPSLRSFSIIRLSTFVSLRKIWNGKKMNCFWRSVATLWILCCSSFDRDQMAAFLKKTMK